MTAAHEQLGIAKGTPYKEARSAYLKAVSRVHPDLNPDNPNATAQTQDINAAWAAYKDSLKSDTSTQTPVSPYAEEQTTTTATSSGYDYGYSTDTTPSSYDYFSWGEVGETKFASPDEYYSNFYQPVSFLLSGQTGKILSRLQQARTAPDSFADHRLLVEDTTLTSHQALIRALFVAMIQLGMFEQAGFKAYQEASATFAHVVV